MKDNLKWNDAEHLKYADEYVLWSVEDLFENREVNFDLTSIRYVKIKDILTTDCKEFIDHLFTDLLKLKKAILLPDIPVVNAVRSSTQRLYQLDSDSTDFNQSINFVHDLLENKQFIFYGLDKASANSLMFSPIDNAWLNDENSELFNEREWAAREKEIKLNEQILNKRQQKLKRQAFKYCTFSDDRLNFIHDWLHTFGLGLTLKIERIEGGRSESNNN
ncbi:hypothetical protein [Persicobacter psychrovividus]|uniref:hypothetical protein n=1 Tax=Persicobacter psychrovividus TaxID=387638 RepID=UPI0030CA55DF